MPAFRSFSPEFLDDLITRAHASPRRRQHLNMHASFSEACQRLFNAIATDSYIRPHKHDYSQGPETIVAIRGELALVVFDDHGDVSEVEVLGSDRVSASAGVEVSPGTWHTIVALTDDAVILEVKGGPFDPTAKFPAPWAPEEGGESAAAYLEELRRLILSAGLASGAGRP